MLILYDGTTAIHSRRTTSLSSCPSGRRGRNVLQLVGIEHGIDGLDLVADDLQHDRLHSAIGERDHASGKPMMAAHVGICPRAWSSTMAQIRRMLRPCADREAVECVDHGDRDRQGDDLVL